MLVLEGPRPARLGARLSIYTLRECLHRMIWIGERQVRKALFEYQEHYHTERNHQGIGNELIESRATGQLMTAVVCRERLGGMLRHYERTAA